MFLYHIKYTTSLYGLGIAAVLANNSKEAAEILQSQGALNATPNSYLINLIKKISISCESKVSDLLSESAIDTSVFIGPKGTKGDLGILGLKGETGNPGLQGILGPQGQKGDKGDKGDSFTYADFTLEQLLNLRGATGPLGPLGIKGDLGILGERGEIGPLGPRGIQGERGPAGDTTEVTQIATSIYQDVTNALQKYKIRVGTEVSSEENTINFII